jgi:hypothetical protein
MGSKQPSIQNRLSNCVFCRPVHIEQLSTDKNLRFLKKIGCRSNRSRRWDARFMRKITPYLLLGLCCAVFCPRPAAALNFSAPKPKFGYTDASGKKQSIEIVDKYYPKKMVQPFGNDPRIDPKLRRAATIAEERARAHSLSKCWHYVKEALVAAGVVKSRPQTTLAKQAGQELVNNYGFKKLPVSDPYQAPVGAVLVYGAKRAAGHVEIRTENGFVSDFRSKTPSRRPLLGVFAKG